MISVDKGHVQMSGKGIEMLRSLVSWQQLCMK